MSAHGCAPCHAITGPPRSGKTSALIARVASALDDDRERSALVLVPASVSLDAIRVTLAQDVAAHHAARIILATPGTLAREVLRAYAPAMPAIIDEAQAALLFEASAASLLSLQWPELLDGSLDPDVAGLRSPQRFLEAALRLIGKLRDANVTPEMFLESGLRGAADFYANLPNFANTDLLLYTKDVYRDSLAVDARELQRQYRRDIDLTKVLARLYRDYLNALDAGGVMTERDAINRATALLASRGEPERTYAIVAIDEVQELRLGEIAFLQRALNERFDGVVLAGDLRAATSTFRGARPERAFSLAQTKEHLDTTFLPPLAATLWRRLTGDAACAIDGDPAGMEVRREATQAGEAAYLADYVRFHLDRGAAAHEIGVLFRSVENVRVYEEALLARDVAVHVVGDANVFLDPRAHDALALLWNVWDPFRHDWLLRTLEAPALALSDATLAILCGDPPSPQTMLFADEPEIAPPQESHSGAMRRVLLGLAVLYGAHDERLSELARERLARFRAMRERWVDASSRMTIASLAINVWNEGLALDGGENSGRSTAQRIVLERLLERIERFESEHPEATLGAFLAYAEQRMSSPYESCEHDGRHGAVVLASIDAVRGRSFEYVALPNARAGTFPRWYVPDAFLYSPSLGIVARENAGDATASRTAKFTYYLFRMKTREHYNAEERRAFAYALTRARRGLLITASGRATRGTTAPEFVEELSAMLREMR